jgi:ABC-type uncharacterized transport system involved in gliding motility auxiliary subunit
LAPTSFLLKVRAFNQVLLISGLVLIFAGILAVLIFNTTNWWNLTLVGLGVVVLGFFLAANLTEVKEVGKKRSTLVRANLSLVALAMFGIVCGLNYVISRHPVRFDMTSSKLYTLADQTKDSLKALKQDVTVTLFVSNKRQTNVQAEVHRAQQLLEEYAKINTKFRFKVVDVDQNPSEAKRLGIHEYNTVVFESGDNRKDVLQRDYVTYALQGRQPTPKFQGEGAFTAALISMNDTTHPVIYFTEGHGEKEMNSPQPEGFNTFKDMLTQQNFTVKSVNLLTSGKVPDDATGLAIVGPTHPIQGAESDLIDDYLKKGGKLVLCVDPGMKVGLDSVFKDFGIKLGNDFLVDQTSYAFPDVRVVIQTQSPALKDVTQTPLMQTTDKGWALTDLKSKTLKFRPGLDTKGPVTMAVACEWALPTDATKRARLVVYGNSNFFTNQFLQGYGNLDLGLNSFSWAAQVENKITIHPKEDSMRVMNLSNVSANFIYYLTVWVMPIAILALGGWVWYRRRSL